MISDKTVYIQGLKRNFYGSFEGLNMLFIHILLAFIGGVVSPVPQLKFGVIDPVLLKRTAYAPDSTAAAVVLAEYVNVEFGTNFEMKVRHHIRIQLLRPEGFDYANISFRYEDSIDDRQNITERKAMIHSLDASGKYVKKELKGADFIVDKITEDERALRFTFPGVVPGAIVEYQIAVKSKGLQALPDHSFLWAIPVERSYFRAEVPDYFRYQILETGTYAYAYKHSNTDKKWYTVVDGGRRGDLEVNATTREWYLENLPALKREAFITSLSNHQQKLRFQVTAYGFEENALTDVSTTWDRVTKRLASDEDFGKRWLVEPDPDAVSKEIGAAATPASKVAALYTAVRDSLIWDNTFSIWASQSWASLKAKRTGSSADINLYLLSKLRKAGLDATPVLIATRSFGRLNTSIASLRQFNHVLVCVIIDGKPQYLDATSKSAPLGLLPDFARVPEGMRIDRHGRVYMVGLPAPEPDSRKSIIDLKIDPSGAITGVLTIHDKGQHVLDDLELLRSPDSLKTLLSNTYFGANPAVQVDSARKEETKSAYECVFKVYFQASGLVQMAGGRAIFDPAFLAIMTKSPFTENVRRLPVEFLNRISSTNMINVRYPESWTVESVPKTAGFQMAADASYRKLIQPQTGAIQIHEQFSRQRVLFPPAVYGELKTFYEQVAASSTSLIVLKTAP